MKPQLRYALIAAILVFAIDLLLSLQGIRGTMAAKGLGPLEYVIMAIALIMAVREVRTAEGGFLSFGRALGTGTVTSVWTALFTAVFSYIYYKFINHSFIDYIREQMQDKLDDKMSGNGAQMESVSKIANLMTTPGGVSVLKFISVFFIGFILSLIIAALLKKDNPNQNQTQENYLR